MTSEICSPQNDSFSVADGDLPCSESGGDNSLDKKTEEKNLIGEKETRDVTWLRLIVLSVLVISAVSVSCTVYFYIKNAEVSQFEDQLASDASKVLGSIGNGVENAFRGLDVLATDLIAYARSTNQTWPFVTMDYFGNRASKIRSVIIGVFVSINVIVENKDRVKWEQFAFKNDGWVNESLKIMETDRTYYGPILSDGTKSKTIYGDFGPIPYNETRKYAPAWLTYPLSNEESFPAYNWDYLAIEDTTAISTVLEAGKAILASPFMLPDLNNAAELQVMEEWAEWYKNFIKPGDNPAEPISDIIYPLIDELGSVKIAGEDDNPTLHKVEGILTTTFYWRDILKGILPSESHGIVAVIHNRCSPSFTYLINGPNATYLGRGDQHDSKFDHLRVESGFFNLHSFSTTASTYTGIPINKEYCPFTISVYPSMEMQEEFISNDPIIFAVIACLIFVFTSIIFICYDLKVERRQKVVATSAEKSNAIVSSLFPSNVRDKLLDKDAATPRTFGAPNELDSLLNRAESSSDKPIADLYPETTVFFSDIAGFTAWSSVRDPYQVFTLLEAIYGAFDKIARTRKVFKVETIGDAYVAVAGIPLPMKNHAVVMARFAHDVLAKMSHVTNMLVASLGPDTAELKLRIGLNSGPTTAGVLRGEKARFQLFGDTVNTAARMESNGLPGRIQCSQKTADLLKAAGKAQWLIKRKDLVMAKGKGELQTYWVQFLGSPTNVSSLSETDIQLLEESTKVSDKMQNIIDWNTDLLEGILVNIIHNRPSISNLMPVAKLNVQQALPIPRAEITESIAIPSLHSERTKGSNFRDAKISTTVKNQLRDFVQTLACMYRDNPFHNFEHASHVVMSTKKVLDRIVSGSGSAEKSSINLDPLAYFAIIFGALIHDVDHQGVSNAQLAQEGAPVAQRYQNQSIAEQNSFDIAWRLLMRSEYEELQMAIFTTEEELKRFRQIVVNVILATDVFDNELKAHRDSRWENVFCTTPMDPNPSQEKEARKLAIVIEHVIQTSDVSHTMQHWKIYQKWNYLLFQETFIAYRSGRCDTHPAEKWYTGELWFFDNYVIPLAKKLKVCGVFGVSCDELLDYALDNRLEWERKGRDIVSQWKNQVEADLQIETDERLAI